MSGRSGQSRGFTIVYGSIVLFAMLGLASLAVDWGRIQTAQTEMQDAVDAAARYAAAGLSDNTCLAKAQNAAGLNKVDGTTLTLLPTDVETGYWNDTTRSFVINGTPRNAVRVYGRRTATRGNAVPLVFARIVGMHSRDVTAMSVARQSSLAAVGIDSITLTNSATIKRRSTEGGGVTVASNGTYTLGGSTSIAGDALYLTTPPTGSITGRVLEMPNTFSYPAVTLPGGMTDNYTVNFSSGSSPVAGNVWVSGDCTFGGTATITLYANTYLYCGGNVLFTGNCTINTNGYRLYVYSYNSGTVTFSASTNVSAIVYAPNSTVSFLGPGAVIGSVVGRNVSINTTLDYTAASVIPFKSTGNVDQMAGGGVVMVKEPLVTSVVP